MPGLELSPLLIVSSVYAFLLLLYFGLRPLLRSPGSMKMVVHKELCNGCGNCVVNCPPNALRSSDVTGGKGPTNGEVVMDIKDGIALEFNINACERVANPGDAPCKLCIDACPLDAIDFTY